MPSPLAGSPWPITLLRADPSAGIRLKDDLIGINGVRLHDSDRGTGRPVVLIHGNAVTGDDYDTGEVTKLLLKCHRVIIFDRPSFGYSERPRGRLWTANQQAELLHMAFGRSGSSGQSLSGIPGE